MSSSVTLVTGASGFVGRVVMARLAAVERRAVGLDPRPSATAHVIDASKPVAARGPVDVEAAARDFGFRARVGHHEGIRRMIEAAG